VFSVFGCGRIRKIEGKFTKQCFAVSIIVWPKRNINYARGRVPVAENTIVPGLDQTGMPQVSGQKRSILLPILTAVLAAGIFAADTATKLEIAVPVFYVAVVLIAVRFCNRRGVILVAAGCIGLTLLSSIFTASDIRQTGMINTAISILVVGLTTVLALRIESATDAAKTLMEADQLRDALIGSVSHELRTPLASILGGVSIMAEMPTITEDPRLASLASGIRDEAMRLNSDIQNLLDAALISSQGLHSRRDWTDPTDIIDTAVERMRRRFPDRRITLSLGSNLPLVHIDPVLVEQALSQIIANAAKFSYSPSAIEVATFVKDGELLISVHDDGVGLTAEEKTKLSERFYRGQRHIGKIPGSGLGLWVANTFIMSSGGKLEASSPGEGKGTTIRVVFPISQYTDENEAAMQEA
jgi:signal transduction histidine kinase